MGNNIAKHIFNLAFGQKQHVTLMVASRYLHSKAPLLSGKRMVSLLLVFLLSLLDYFTQKGRSRCTRWEPSVSTVETGRFHGGNRSFPWWEQTRNYVLENLTRGLSPCELTRLVVSLLLMLVVGVNNVWGQATDYSGVYYIASDYQNSNDKVTRYYDFENNTNNFYLCPTEGWISYKASSPNWEIGDAQPFLTTYIIYAHDNYDKTKAKWTIEYYATIDGTDYYYIKHSSGQYMVLNNSISAVSGNNKALRIRVHLETLTSEQLAVENKRNMALFAIYPERRSIIISPKTQSAYHLTVNKGNGDSLQGENRNNGGTITSNGITYGMSGTIGIYSDSNDDSQYFYLEDCITRPTISFNESNQVVITAVQVGATLVYTTNGTTPTALNGTAVNGTAVSSTTVTITPADSVTTIKAIAIVNGEVSNVATTTVLTGSTHPYLIQNLGSESISQDGFFMLPDAVVNGEITVNTSSLARPSMRWYFKLADVEKGFQYYHIYNTGKDGNEENYLFCNSSGTVYLKPSNAFVSASDDFKFRLLGDASTGYRIEPKSYQNNWLQKGGTNSNNASNVVSTNNKDNFNKLQCRWIIIPVFDNKMPTALRPSPFNVTTSSVAAYYKIGNAAEPNAFIIPGTTSATTSATDVAESNDMKWYFLEAGSDDWLTYYHIVNATTGKYLYYNKDVEPTSEQSNAFITQNLSTTNADRYQFVVAKTTESASDGKYYVVPKVLDLQSNNKYWSVRRNGTNTLKVNLQRSDDDIKWTFTPTTFTCAVPVVTYDNDNDRIVISSTQGANVYYTINGGSNILYEDPIDNTNTGPTQTISAVCARNADQSDASSAVTIVLNPTITLEEESVTLTDASVTYDGSGHQPTISSVEYNSTNITSECTFAKYLDKDGNVVSECVNAGEYKVVITDAEGGDYYVYGSTTFTINPASLTITPNDGQSKEYGDPDPELTYTSSGLLTGDELTGALSRDEGEVVGGTYYITQSTLGNPNYTASFTTGKTFTITAKSLGSGSTPAPNITCDVTETGGTHSIVVKQCGNNLILDTDYTKEGENDGAKYYQVTVKGKGNYKDGFSVKLAKIQLSKLSGSSAPGGAALFVSNSGDGNFVVPDNMTAYIVTGINGNTLVTEQLNNIPEQVPVLLVSTIDANGFLVNTTTGTTPSGTNLLKVKANDWENIPAATIYLLYNGEFVLNAAGTLPAGKIYLPRPSGAPSRLFINWDEVTGIEDDSPSIMDHSPFNEVWYTLDGRRLNGQPKKKGLYLNNGKKVVIR